MSKENSLEFELTYDGLNLIIGSLKELVKLADNCLIKFSEDDILLYSLVGQGKNINAFRSFVFKPNQLFNKWTNDKDINYIVKDLKNFIKSINNFTDYQKSIKGKLTFDEINEALYCDKIVLSIPKELKLNFTGDEPITMNCSITVEDILEYSNLDNSLFSFNMKKEQFDKIKRLSMTDTKNDVFNINKVKDDGETFIAIGELRWNLVLEKIDYNDEIDYNFPKKYFKTISINSDLQIIVFETHLLIKETNSSLLISLENNG